MLLVSPEAESIQVLTPAEGAYTVHGTFGGSESVRSMVLPDLDLPAQTIFAAP